MSNDEDKWVFDVQIVGRGITKEQAWYDAKVNFCEDPVGPNKTTFIPYDPWEEWHKGGCFTVREIRAHVKKIAARHKEFKGIRFVLMDEDSDGIQCINNIWQFTCLEQIAKKYPYRGDFENTVQKIADKKILIIEEIPHTDETVVHVIKN